MKTSIIFLGIALLGSSFIVNGDSGRGEFDKPCFSVNVQNDVVNTSNVQQNCDRNFSRTVQSGSRNLAHTVQSGKVNDNKVRQYWYDRMEYLGRIRGE